MGFFKSLLSADGEISSKRVAGLSLIGLFIVGTIYGAITGGLVDVIESLLNKGLYTGSGLLGINVAESVMKTYRQNGDK